MDLKNKAWEKRKIVLRGGYALAALGLFIVALVLTVQMVTRTGRTPASLLMPTPAHAEEASALRLLFVDSETGARLDPDVLLIDRQDFTGLVANGQTDFPATSKTYVVTVIKDGYESMDEIFVEPTSGGYTEFRLFPSRELDRTDHEPIGLGDKEGRIVGYIRDRETGAPLSSATVRLEGQSQLATTEDNGYFSLSYVVTAQDETDPSQIETDTLRFEAEGYIAQERLYVQLFSGTEIKYLVNLDPAPGGTSSPPLVQTIDERRERGGAAAEADQWTPDPPSVRSGTPEDLGEDTAPVEPSVMDSANKIAGAHSHNIRVGFNCSCRSCSRVVVMHLEDYARHVLPAEWIPSWSMNALEAGAIAVRSYSGSFIINPISRRYDICTNTCCQAYSASTNSRTNRAITATSGLVVLRNGRPFRAEYASENNGAAPCRRNCYTGTCLSDVVCCGTRLNGHGRGMCQYGSQRWGSGAPRSGGAKNRTWIVDHYYKNNPGYRGLGLHIGRW